MTRYLFNRAVVAAFLAGTLLSHAGRAEAQTLICPPRQGIVAWLGEHHGEKQIGYGLAAGHLMVEIHVSPNGSWTVLATFADGRSCPVFSGHFWTAPVPPASIKMP